MVVVGCCDERRKQRETDPWAHICQVIVAERTEKTREQKALAPSAAPVDAPASPVAAPAAAPAAPVAASPVAAPVAAPEATAAAPAAPAPAAVAEKERQKQKSKKNNKQKNNKKNRKILKRGLQVRPVRSRIAPGLIQQWTQTLGALPEIIMGIVTGSDGEGHDKCWTVDWGNAIISSHKAKDLLIVPPEPPLQCPTNMLGSFDTTPIFQVAKTLRTSVFPRAGRGGPGNSITAAAAAAAAAAVAVAAAAATATSTTQTTTTTHPQQTLEAVATMYHAKRQQSELLRTLADPQLQAARLPVVPQASELREYLSPAPSRSLRLTFFLAMYLIRALTILTFCVQHLMNWCMASSSAASHNSTARTLLPKVLTQKRQATIEHRKCRLQF
jgi:hypothetical protein